MRYAVFVLALLLGCSSVPAPPPAGSSQAWGHVVLVPREGVTPGGATPSSYGDRRLADVEFVDYARPGFSVVYTESGPARSDVLALSIVDARAGLRVEPELAAVGSAGRIVLHNETDEAHVVSYPAADLVRRVEPGERLELAVPHKGEQAVFLLDGPAIRSIVFAAPGPYTVVAASGRYVLPDLLPGAHTLRVWHPRFPPASRDVMLLDGESLELDLEIGVGRGDHAAH